MSSTAQPSSSADIEIATHLEPGWADKALCEEVLSAFTSLPKELSPRWLYDERGSEIFDEITTLEEYYPTEAERSLLTEYAAAIVNATGVETIVELGSGSSDKTRTLLDAFQSEGKLKRFVPFDVSETMLRFAAELLHERYPGVTVSPVVGDFNLHLDQLPTEGPRLVAFLGGTIGNFYPEQRTEFLRSVASILAPGEWFLLGADLVKDPARILAAYNDAKGVTAEFILNVLNVLNRELDANLPIDEFEYRPSWNSDQERIEMRLRAMTEISATIGALDLPVVFAEGEELHVEISSKFRPDELSAELAAVGLEVKEQWSADGDDFGLFLAQRIATS